MKPLTTRVVPPMPALLALVLALGTGPFALADDPCADANEAAQKVTSALTASLTDATEGSAFAVKAAEKAGIAIAYDITYSVDGVVVAKARAEGSPADKLTGWNGYMDLAAKATGPQVDLTWDTGGSHCCKCQFTIVASGKKFRAAARK